MMHPHCDGEFCGGCPFAGECACDIQPDPDAQAWVAIWVVLFWSSVAYIASMPASP